VLTSVRPRPTRILPICEAQVQGLKRPRPSKLLLRFQDLHLAGRHYPLLAEVAVLAVAAGIGRGTSSDSSTAHGNVVWARRDKFVFFILSVLATDACVAISGVGSQSSPTPPRSRSGIALISSPTDQFCSSHEQNWS
jgi:hypothetical protein